MRLIGGARYVDEDFTTTINEQVLIQVAQFLGVDPETGYPQFPVGSDLDTLEMFGLGNSFNGRMRDELLNGEIFYTLMEAQVVIENWRKHYNTKRPHSSLGYRPPSPEVVIPKEMTGTMETGQMAA